MSGFHCLTHARDASLVTRANCGCDGHGVEEKQNAGRVQCEARPPETGPGANRIKSSTGESRGHCMVATSHDSEAAGPGSGRLQCHGMVTLHAIQIAVV